LNQAKTYLDQGINWGYTAGAQTLAGQTMGSEEAKARADRTKDYNSIMNQEAIAAMSTQLKGATSNLELAEFIKNMNDPTIDPTIKAKQIDRMLAKARAFNELQRQRIGELGGDVPQTRPQLTPEAEAELLDGARKAIAAGADADLVKKRLTEKGGDPGKL
jgi:hypothetical protein